MQYKNTIYVQYNETNRYGQTVLSVEKPLKGIISSITKKQFQGENKDKTKIEIQFITDSKNISPYTDLVDNELITFRAEDMILKCKSLTRQNDFSGKPKAYELVLHKYV